MKASELSSFQHFLHFIHVFWLVSRFNIDENTVCLMESFHGLCHSVVSAGTGLNYHW